MKWEYRVSFWLFFCFVSKINFLIFDWLFAGSKFVQTFLYTIDSWLSWQLENSHSSSGTICMWNWAELFGTNGPFHFLSVPPLWKVLVFGKKTKAKLLWTTNVKFGKFLTDVSLPNKARASTTPNENSLFEWLWCKALILFLLWLNCIEVGKNVFVHIVNGRYPVCYKRCILLKALYFLHS